MISDVSSDSTLSAEEDAAFSDDDLVQLSMAELRDHPVHAVVPMQDPQLPFGDLPPETFERLCAELVDNETVSGEVHIYGRRGQEQYGIDVVKFRMGLQGEPSVPAHVYQVKRYKRMTPTKLRNAVELYAESHRFKADKFTVMTAAPTEDTPLLDELAKLKEEFAGRFDVALDGPTKIQNRLRKHATTVRAVFGKAMAEALCGEPGLEPPVLLVDIKTPEPHIRALKAAMEQDFRYDNPVRFNEAELNVPSVDSMFVDVPVVAHARTLAGQLITDLHLNGIQFDPTHDQEFATSFAPSLKPAQSSGEAGRIGPISLRIGQTTYEPLVFAGGAQALLHPRWLESAVIVGGPGQGKSTLLQYVCQSLRARQLGFDEYEPRDQQIQMTAAMPRIPFRVDLRLYAKTRREILLKAAGLDKQDKKRRRPTKHGPAQDINDPEWIKGLSADIQRSILLESYISERICISARGVPFEINDLVKVVIRWPTLFALDGLDEVAPLDDRAAVSDEIRDFRQRYAAEGVDVIVFVTTRPGVVERPIWNDPSFAVLELGDLVPALKMRYVEKWAVVSLPPDRQAPLVENFAAEHDKPHVREVSSSPMQLAILCRLLDRHTVIPDQRTALYDEYISVFFDREFEKSEAIRPYRPTLAKIHAYLGWWMHTQAEGGDSNGTIDVKTLRTLLHEFLTGIGQSTEMVEQLYTEMQARVICLVQRRQGSGLFEFEVQGIREYFAAQYLIKDLDPDSSGTKGERLGEAIRRPYWWNTMRFAAGMFNDGELPEIRQVLRDLQRNDFRGQPLPRLAAKQLLDDHIFRTVHRTVTEDLIKDALAGTGLILALDGMSVPGAGQFTFPSGPAADALTETLKDRILVGPSDERRAAAALLCEQLDRRDGDPDARSTTWQWWWGSGAPSEMASSQPTEWLQTACALRLLSDLEPDEERRLVDVIARAAVDEPLNILAALAYGGRWSPGNDLYELCLQDLADGAADGYLPPVPSEASAPLRRQGDETVDEFEDVFDDEAHDVEGIKTGDPDDEVDDEGKLLVSGPLGQLVRASQVDRCLAEARRVEPVASPPNQHVAGPKVRRRIRGHDKAIRTTVASLDSAFSALQAKQNYAGWADFLDALEDTWGDSWILRQVMLLTLRPTTQAAAAQLSASGQPSTTRAWPALASWLQTAEANRADVEWWRNALADEAPDEADPRGTRAMFQVAVALVLPSSLALSQLGPELNALCEQLTPGQWGRVAAACTRAASEYDRPLRVSQQLRTTFRPSGRLATLILARADDATASEAVRYIFPNLPGLWGAAPASDVLLRRLVASVPHKLELNNLRASRGSLPRGRYFAVPAIQGITVSQCEQVLANPSQWPADAVAVAAAKAESRFTSKLVTMGELASETNWSTPGADADG